MGITRRQFIQRTGLATAGALWGSGLFGNPFVRQALAETIGDRYLVVFFLDGGNDGLNTVVPHDNVGGLRTAYEAARNTGSGGLRLSPGDLLLPASAFKDPNTNTQLGFHPALVGFKDLYDQGRLAVVQSCGYPEHSLSHDVSTLIWESGFPLGSGGLPGGTGWVGRHLALEYIGSDIPAVNIARSIAGEFKQTATSVLAIRRLDRFGFPYDPYDHSDASAKRDAFAALYNAASLGAQATVSFIGDAGQATLTSSESYPVLDDTYETERAAWSQLYDDIDRGSARDLREIAKIIYGVANGAPGVNARFFQARNGGYDTHADQGGAETDGSHYDLHREVGDSLKLFYDDLDDMGVADKVCTVVWSEFSRRIEQNDNGTDHGSQGPMFIIGDAVNGGVYGNHPNIDALALDEDGNTEYTQDANPFRSTDFRDVYGTVLKHWLNMTHADVLANALQLDAGDPTYYWTSENFDLGFLP